MARASKGSNLLAMVDVEIQCFLLSSDHAAADNLDMSREETSAGVIKCVLGMVPSRSQADSVTTSAQCSHSPELGMQSDTHTLAHECNSCDEDYDMELEFELEYEVEDLVRQTKSQNIQFFTDSCSSCLSAARSVAK